MAGNRGLRNTGSAHAVPGHLHGLRQPGLVFRLASDSSADPAWLAQVDAWFANALGVPAPTGPHDTVRAALEALLHWLFVLQQRAGLSVFGPGRVVTRDAPDHFSLAVPVPPGAQGAIEATVAWLLRLTEPPPSGGDRLPWLRQLPQFVDALAGTLPSDPHVTRFIHAAGTIDAPVAQLTGALLQFGQGARSRRLLGTFTSGTSHIATLLARHKLHAAELMRLAGVPVPDHLLVQDAEQAVQAAAQLGFPVVVKPADLDGGAGVALGLGDATGVRQAFAAARALSLHVLVERQAPGRDYRLVVFQGEMVWAVERVPGGVVGDGQTPLRVLLDRLNADPRRGQLPQAALQRIEWDAEAQAMARQQGFGASDVPPLDRFVRLRRVGNVYSGGMPVAVNEQVHPDNRALAVRAAAALQLDLAGIDLLIPDIARSWREVGAAVCDVNAQPFLGQLTTAGLPAPMLRRLLNGNGCIPVVWLVGLAPAPALQLQLVQRLRDQGWRVGVADRDGAWIEGAEGVGSAPAVAAQGGLFPGGRSLLIDRRVDAALLCIDHIDVLRTGMPFDRCDVLVLAGPDLALSSRSQQPAPPAATAEVLAALWPNCRGPMLLHGPASRDAALRAGVPATACVDVAGGVEGLAQAVTAALLEADARHRGV